ncbi:MAG: SDR family oxidoreductase, partial [Thaumarchaeota archaeon]|nr:SDR family oxidoreductase [Nitrososphaerota archaeon]
IVTGSSKGIGKAVAGLFASEGASVVIVSGSSLDAAKVMTEDIERKGGVALPIKADVSKADEVQAMVDAAINRFRRVDILVNNAGIQEIKKLVDITEEQWDRMIDVHLKGTFLCTKAVAPHMIAQKFGRIINVSAPSALRGSPAHADYAAAKGGIISLTKTAAKELAPWVNVNCVVPVAKTAMTAMEMAYSGRSEEEQKARYPLQRFAQPDEIAPVFLFFASKDSSYVTGQVLAVDGGLTS